MLPTCISGSQESNTSCIDCAAGGVKTSRSHWKMGGWRGDAVGKSCVIPTRGFRSNASSAPGDATFTRFYSGHHRLCQTGASTPRHPPFWGNSAVSDDGADTELHFTPHSTRERFLLLFPADEELRKQPGERGEMANSASYGTRSLRPYLFCYTLYIYFTWNSRFLSSQQWFWPG